MQEPGRQLFCAALQADYSYMVDSELPGAADSARALKATDCRHPPTATEPTANSIRKSWDVSASDDNDEASHPNPLF